MGGCKGGMGVGESIGGGGGCYDRSFLFFLLLFDRVCCVYVSGPV